MSAARRELSDLFSPVLVKEVRQGMKTKSFVAVFLLLQVVLLFSMLLALLPQRPESADETWALSTTLFWGTAVCLIGLGLPLRGLGAVAEEMNARTFELVLLTRLSARRIVLGKWASLLTQCLLVASALLPYLVLRYFLGGVNVLLDGTLLALLLLESALLTALTVFASTYTVLWRAAFVLIAVLPQLSLLGLLVEVGRGGSPDLMAILGALAALVGFGVALLLELAAARIAPPGENHSTPKRLLLLVLWPVGWAALQTGAPGELVLGAMATLLMPLLMNVCAEELPDVPQLLAPFRRLGPAGQVLAALLAPGWTSAALYAVLLLGLCALSFPLFFAHGSPHDFFLAALCLLLVPLALARLFRLAPRHLALVDLGFLLLNGLLALLAVAVEEIGGSANSDPSAWLPDLVPLVRFYRAFVESAPRADAADWLHLLLVIAALLLLALRGREALAQLRALQARLRATEPR